jgi:hypothetical protein
LGQKQSRLPPQSIVGAVTSLISLPPESDQPKPAYGSKYDTNQIAGYKPEVGHTGNSDDTAAPDTWVAAATLQSLTSSPSIKTPIPYLALFPNS